MLIEIQGPSVQEPTYEKIIFYIIRVIEGVHAKFSCKNQINTGSSVIRVNLYLSTSK